MINDLRFVLWLRMVIFYIYVMSVVLWSADFSTFSSTFFFFLFFFFFFLSYFPSSLITVDFWFSCLILTHSCIQ